MISVILRLSRVGLLILESTMRASSNSTRRACGVSVDAKIPACEVVIFPEALPRVSQTPGSVRYCRSIPVFFLKIRTTASFSAQLIDPRIVVPDVVIFLARSKSPSSMPTVKRTGEPFCSPSTMIPV